MKKLNLLVAGAVVFVALQLVRPSIPERPPAAELEAPPEVRRILEKDCFSCHSDQRRLAWFDEVVPAYWLVRHDILTAREHLNFSTLGSKPAAVQRATLFEAVNMIQLGAMPLPSFRKLHPEANVTPEELAILKAYLAPWNSLPPGPPTNPPVSSQPAAPIALGTVPPELNGLPFDATFESWKPISTTDRGDNNTFRFILGNEIAVDAVRSGKISPWPDGARLAKIAWQQQLGADGIIHPGNFIQVELMVKAARPYRRTEGWGWGRWRGLDLKPYGKDTRFVTECTTCHLPVRGNDYVYTLPITSAKLKGVEVVNNTAAALPETPPYQPLGWDAITMYVDPKTHTTATLFGNQSAISAVRSWRANPGPPAYPQGAVLALVTWTQRDDPHWFGGRVPHQPQTVEFVAFNGTEASNYSRYSGSGELQAPEATAAGRTSFIAALSPARLP
jgi:hypothetical protein